MDEEKDLAKPLDSSTNTLSREERVRLDVEEVSNQIQDEEKGLTEPLDSSTTTLSREERVRLDVEEVMNQIQDEEKDLEKPRDAPTNTLSREERVRSDVEEVSNQIQDEEKDLEKSLDSSTTTLSREERVRLNVEEVSNQIQDEEKDLAKSPDSSTPTLSREERVRLDVEEVSNRIQLIYRSLGPTPTRGAYADPKSVEGSIRFREKGVTAFMLGRYDKAVYWQNKALATAPEGSAELFKAYDKRSSVLLEKGAYEACLLDVNRVLRLRKCPKKLKNKLRERKKECQAKDEERRGHALRQQFVDAVESPSSEREKEDYTSQWIIICNFDPPNDILPKASPKIKLTADRLPEWDSAVKATQNIEPGEIIWLEENYAMSLPDRDKQFGFCSHCLIRWDHLIPCPSCTQTMYCSEKCLEKAYDMYHRTECQLIRFYDRECKGFYYEEVLLVIRTFLRGTGQGTQLSSLMSNLKPCDIFNRFDEGPFDKPYVENDYVTLMKFCGVHDYDDVSILEKSETALRVIVKLIVALRNLQFFPQDRDQRSKNEDRLSEVELFAALLLINNLLVVTDRSCIIVERDGTPEDFCDWSSFGESWLGRVLYILHNCVEYSCYPNTQYVIQERQRVLFATRPIKAGESIFFGGIRPTFAVCPKTERVPDCICEACLNDWPLYEELRKRRIRFRDAAKKAEFRKMLNNHWKVLLKIKRPEDVNIDAITTLIKSLVQFLYADLETPKPSYDLFVCEEMLSRAMKTFFSDYHHVEVRGLITGMVRFVAELSCRYMC